MNIFLCYVHIAYVWNRQLPVKNIVSVFDTKGLELSDRTPELSDKKQNKQKKTFIIAH